MKAYRDYGILPALGLTPVVGFLSASTTNEVLGFIAIFLVLIVLAMAAKVFE